MVEISGRLTGYLVAVAVSLYLGLPWQPVVAVGISLSALTISNFLSKEN